MITLVVLSAAVWAQAQQRPTLSGTWSATAMIERWNIGDWGPKCGERPAGRGGGAGTVTISQVGNELMMSGAGGSYSTTNCWEQGAGLNRVSHSASARGWSNRCASAPGDPRSAVVVTTITATDDRISFDETGQYQFVLEGQNCTASVRRSRSFRLLQRAGEAPPAASSSAAPPPPSASVVSDAGAKPPVAKALPAPSRCASPGPPRRIDVRPARKLLRPGEEFTFNATVSDAGGCRLALTPAWRVGSGNATVHVQPSGKVRIDDDSSEGSVDVLASLGGQNVKVTVEVASAEHYEQLLTARGFDERGEAGEASVAVVASGGLGGGSIVAKDGANKRKLIFVALVGTAALLLAVGGFVMLRRGNKPKRVREERADEGLAHNRRARPRNLHEAMQGTEDAPHVKMVCPVCRLEHPPGTTYCSRDGTRLLKASPLVELAQRPSGGICPVCERGFALPLSSCPEHGETLIPAALFKATKRAVVVEKRGKICPTCGARYGGEATFCGNDGTTLVLVN